jgi:hypothetical protein
MYNANQLNERILKAIQVKYPNFKAFRFIVSSTPGQGKSTLLASVPTPEGKQRLVLDNEDSMAYLDAGKEGNDIYTPTRQQFRMVRKSFPELADYASYYKTIKAKPEKIGALLIDNIAILQDIIVGYATSNASNPNNIVSMWTEFDQAQVLPHPNLMRNWGNAQDGRFWQCVKAIPSALLLICMKNSLHFVGSTEEGNVWENYGKPGAKIVGRKAKIWDKWYQYTDFIISLKRNPNTHEPPLGSLYPNQPKMRLQNMNPSWMMDWENFAKELEDSNKREGIKIPTERQIKMEEEVTED